MSGGNIRDLWTRKLSEALRNWCDRNGYRTRNVLAQELSIRRSIWESIIIGKSVASDVEIYARIFLKTGLPEANPTTVPDHSKVLPRDGRRIFIHRAWTQEQFENWKKRQSRASQPLVAAVAAGSQREEKKEVLPSALPPSSPTTAGGILDAFIERFADQVSQRVAERLGERSTIQQPLELRFLAVQLANHLKSYLNAGPEQRDELIRKYQTELREVWTALHPLMLPPDQREQSIRMTREVGSGR